MKLLKKDYTTYENFNPQMKQIIQELNTEFDKFLYHNEVITGDLEFDKIINEIIIGMPDILLITGKPQHKTHNYTVDIHTMLVLQNALKNSTAQPL